MKNLIKNNQKVYMIPKDIQGGLSSAINKIVGSTIEMDIKKDDMKYYSLGDVVEMFTVIDDGILYFKPRVVEIDKGQNTIKVEFDKTKYDQLQRREYTRIDFKNEFTLKSEDKSFVCTCIDLSAGGMKFETEADLKCSQDYEIEFSLESKIPIECFFKPIRIDKKKGRSKVKKNIVSGRFIALKNIDKIAIVQFCFKKQMENKNK